MEVFVIHAGHEYKVFMTQKQCHDFLIKKFREHVDDYVKRYNKPSEMQEVALYLLDQNQIDLFLVHLKNSSLYYEIVKTPIEGHVLS